MSHLTFTQLREANLERLPQFKNKHGQLAHTTSDGHDWSPAQWFQAIVGELGELARVRMDYEAGTLSRKDYVQMVAKETADVQIYLDIFAKRCLDVTEPDKLDSAQLLMSVVASLGEYANERKKFDRKDIGAKQLHSARAMYLYTAQDALRLLYTTDVEHAVAKVIAVDAEGVDLGEATRSKFNEVSVRVGCEVKL